MERWFIRQNVQVEDRTYRDVPYILFSYVSASGKIFGYKATAGGRFVYGIGWRSEASAVKQVEVILDSLLDSDLPEKGVRLNP